jgi:hypothetical protein
MLDLDLPAIALAFLSARKASRTGPHADGSTTAALLTSRRYPAHPALLAFESAYGGLQMFESDPTAPSLVVGPYACFSAKPPYTGREGELVPVIFAWDDVRYSLDADGRGWTCAAMVEGISRPSAPDGRTLLTQAILWRVVSASPSLVFRPGLHGSAMAEEHHVGPLMDATGETERWWGNGERLVVEIDRGNGYETPMTYASSG